MTEQIKSQKEPRLHLLSPRAYLLRLLLIILGINLFVTALASLLLYRNRLEHIRKAEIITLNYSNILKENISGSIGQINILLQSTVYEIERQLATGKIDKSQLNKYLSRQRQRIPELNSLRVADAAADTLYGTDGAKGSPKNILERDYFIQLRNDPNSGLVIGKPVIGMISNKWVIIFARRFNNPDATFAGVVLCGIPLDYFTKTFSTLDVGRHGSITLRTDDLFIIASYPNSTAMSRAVGDKREYPNFRELVQSGRSSASYLSISPVDNIKRFTTFNKIDSYPMYINVGLASKDILADWNKEALTVALGMVCFFLSSLMSAYFIYGSRKREIISELELYRQQQLLEILIDNIPAIVYLKDIEGRLLTCSQNLADFLKIPKFQVIGKTSRDFFPPDIAEKQIADDALVTLNGTVVSSEEFIEKHDGVHIFQTVKLPIRNTEGEITGLCGISTDITERKQTEEALQKKNAEMEQFTYSVSHDMRSPLVTIKTFIGYLQQDISNANSQRISQDMQFITSAADKMELMLNELLQLSRLGRVTNPPERVSYSDLVTEAIGAVAGGIAQLNIAVKVADLNIMLYGDRPRLVQIWQNLLDNAVKYIGDQPKPLVEIGAELIEDKTVFFVRDNGIGVDTINSEKIFGIFAKLDTNTRGAGIGLATVKRIVEMYGGRIWLESDGVGKGACFWFTMPEAIHDVTKLRDE